MGVALRDIVAEYKRSVEWESLAGVAAVDAHNALYQFLSIIRQPDGTPLLDRQGRVTSHLSGILFRTVNFLVKGIRPVYVFDGAPPEFKGGTIEQRRSARREAHEKWQDALARGDAAEAYKQARSSARIDRQVLETSKQLLGLMGIPVIQAPSEGEAQAARMVMDRRAGYVVSQDYDTLLFGGPVLARNLTISGRRKVRGRSIVVNPETIRLDEALSGLRISRENLIQIGILVGTDFNPGVYGIGAKKALKIVREGQFLATLQEKSPGFDPEPILEFFKNPPVAPTPELEWKPPDREGIVGMLCRDYDFSEERVKKALDLVLPKGGQRTLESWF